MEPETLSKKLPLCLQCNKNPRKDKCHYYGIPMCQICFDQTIRDIQNYKKSKTELSIQIDQILDNLYLGLYIHKSSNTNVFY